MVQEVFPTATVVRPADTYGHEDRFLHYYASLRVLPFGVIPVMSGADQTTKRPVYVSVCMWGCGVCVWSVGVGCVCVCALKAISIGILFSLHALCQRIYMYTALLILLLPPLSHTQVGDIAHAVGSIISDSATAGKTYELAG